MCKHITELSRSTGTRTLPEKKIPIAEQEDIIKNFNTLLSEIEVRLKFENSKTSSPIKEELFRSEIVMLVSALDYYMFEILKTSIIQIYLRERETTTKFDTLKLPMKFVTSALENPESNEWLSEAILDVFGTSSFQSVWQINFVLSIISNISNDKLFGEVAAKLNLSKTRLEKKITAICKRRHQIAHNCDIPRDSDVKEEINIKYLNDCIKLIGDFINELHKLVIV